jgi:hypothetical protein
MSEEEPMENEEQEHQDEEQEHQDEEQEPQDQSTAEGESGGSTLGTAAKGAAAGAAAGAALGAAATAGREYLKSEGRDEPDESDSSEPNEDERAANRPAECTERGRGSGDARGLGRVAVSSGRPGKFRVNHL